MTAPMMGTVLSAPERVIQTGALRDQYQYGDAQDPTKMCFFYYSSRFPQTVIVVGITLSIAGFGREIRSVKKRVHLPYRPQGQRSSDSTVILEV